MKTLARLLCFLIILQPLTIFAEENYTFELSEIEKKPYSLGGYIEFQPVLFGLDKDASLYKLKFYNKNEGETVEEYSSTLQLDGSYEKGIARLYAKLNLTAEESFQGWSDEAKFYEGYLSLKPLSFFNLDFGKKTMNWGKGYAWNPVAFVDRIRDPDDPQLAREGFIVASADYTKSFQGKLKTLSLSSLLVPVYEDVNDDFGKTRHLNFAGKLYLLLYDTDIDFMFLAGESKPNRYGMDFSRNLKTNFEVHGEFALIEDFEKKSTNQNGFVSKREYDAASFLLGLRYLTKNDTTYIFEYYRNGTGFIPSEMRDYFSFVNTGYDTYLSNGNDSALKKASNIAGGSYNGKNPMRDYFYLRISQKEPFDILYFTPAVTWIYNANDRSFSLSPELLYTGITNFELRAKAGVLIGERDSEYGEKQNDYRIELRLRYYFDAVKLLNGVVKKMNRTASKKP
jgi:hypothetical protein